VLENSEGRVHPNKKIRVSAPARLHLGFLDLNGSSGRKFGSIGLAINSFRTTVDVSFTQDATTHSDITAKVQSIIDKFYDTLGRHIAIAERDINLNVIEQIPEHAGFGSGTQLALTIGTALCKLHNISASTQEIAEQLGRGARSGIGIATFDTGGFIVDGGLSDTSAIPPLLIRHNFPETWRIVLIMDNNHQGVHGKSEVNAFKNLPPFKISDTHAICHITLMKLLPALIEHNIDIFGQAVTDIQTMIGDHFSPEQGGRYTSPFVAQLLQQSQLLGHKGIAQSSWGPTGCVFVDSDHTAEKLKEFLIDFTQQKKFDGISITIAKADSIGANINDT